MVGVLVVVCGLGLAVLAWRLMRWTARSLGGRVLRVAGVWLVGFCATVAILGGTYWVWFMHRSQPEPEQRALFDGITYRRDVRQYPRPMVVHLAEVRLDVPGIRLAVSSPSPEGSHDAKAHTTRKFVRERKVQLAINAGFFQPFRWNHPLDYYPHPGDPVSMLGPAVSDGIPYGRSNHEAATLYIGRQNEISFGVPFGEPWQAVSGLGYVLKDGQVMQPTEDVAQGGPYPRAAVGADAARRRLFLLVVDGNQPGYSEGATLMEVAAMMQAAGADTAIQLDGGGSATMVAEAPDGRPTLLSVPVNFHLVGWERAVGNHLGVYARPCSAKP